MNRIYDLLNFKNPDSDKIPDIPLYMDQLLEYLQNQLSVLLRQQNESVFTKTMINNYVKSKVICAPERKKYNHEALKDLILIYHFKQCFSMQDVDALIKMLKNTEHYYKTFTEHYEEKKSLMKNTLSKTVDEYSVDELKQLALELSIDASIKKKFSEELLDIIQQKTKKNVDN